MKRIGIVIVCALIVVGLLITAVLNRELLKLFVDISSVLSVLIVGGSAFIAYKVFFRDEKTKKRFYWDLFIPQYLDATFTYNEKKIELKEGRLEIKNRYPNWEKEGYEKFAKDSQNNKDVTYENKLAHRLSVVLNRIGQAAFVGDLPLEYIFPISSKMILEDWEMSKALINKQIRGPENVDYRAINYSRKFFRWIACASCIYLIVHYADDLEQEEKYIKQYASNHDEFKLYKNDLNEIIKNIELLQKSDKMILADSTRQYIKRLMGRMYKQYIKD